MHFKQFHTDSFLSGGGKIEVRQHLLRGDFGLLCHSLSQPGHGARERHRHPDSHAVGALALVYHCHIQRPATHNGSD